MDFGSALRAIATSGETAARYAPILAAEMPAFAIDTPARAAAFLAQCHVESAGFTRLSENLSYGSAERLCAVWPSRFRTIAAARPYVRAPERLANRVYAGRLGNGAEASGDGWRFRGRGLKQLTGRANYQAAARALARPYGEQPDLVATPADAVRTACWYWRTNGCNELADNGALDSITRRINGPAMLKARERRRLSEQLLSTLNGMGKL